MAVNIGVGDIVQVTIKGKLDGQVVMNVLQYRVTATPGTVDYVTNLTQLNAKLGVDIDSLYAKYYDCLSSDYVSSFTMMQLIYELRFFFVEFPPYQGNGNYDGFSLPPGCSVSIVKRAESANRHGIGGVRMPAVPLDANDNGQVEATFVTRYNALATRLSEVITIAAGTVFTPIILNRAAPGDSLVLASAACEYNIRTMSRRVLGRGI